MRMWKQDKHTRFKSATMEIPYAHINSSCVWLKDNIVHLKK